MATARFGTSFRTPLAYRAITVAITGSSRLTPDMMRQAALFGGVEDVLLPQYKVDWWNFLDEQTAPGFESISDVMAAFKADRTPDFDINWNREGDTDLRGEGESYRQLYKKLTHEHLGFAIEGNQQVNHLIRSKIFKLTYEMKKIKEELEKLGEVVPKVEPADAKLRGHLLGALAFREADVAGRLNDHSTL